MEGTILRRTALLVFLTAVFPALLYSLFLGCLITLPSLQSHLIYLHSLGPGGKDPALLAPERVGFLHKQVTSHFIPSTDGVSLHAWHILPLDVYEENREALVAQDEGKHVGTTGLALELLRSDPSARLIIYMHGVAGNIATGRRPESYRSLVTASSNTHILAFDYRGFGLSASTEGPTELGLVQDAMAAFNWVITEAKITPERVVFVGQSLGTAVTLALADECAAQDTNPAGIVLTAPFSDMATLTSTYRIFGHFPVLSPLARIKPLFEYFSNHLQSQWLSKYRIASLIRRAERVHLTMIHAEDDETIPSSHADTLFWHACNAARNTTEPFQELESRKKGERTSLGEAGWTVHCPVEGKKVTQVMLKYAAHDKAVTYPAVALAVAEAFRSTSQESTTLGAP